MTKKAEGQGAGGGGKEGNTPGAKWFQAPTKNSDILTAPLNQSTIGRRDINVDEGAVKMSGFIVTPGFIHGKDRLICTQFDCNEVQDVFV